MVAGGGYVDCLKINYTPSVHHHNFTPCTVWLINLVLIYLVYDSQKEPLSGMGYFTKQDQFIVNFKLIFACNITCFLKSICIDLFKTPVQSANTNSFTCRSSLLLSNNYIVLIDYKTFSRSNHPSAQLPSLFVTTIAMVKRNKAKTHFSKPLHSQPTCPHWCSNFTQKYNNSSWPRVSALLSLTKTPLLPQMHMAEVQKSRFLLKLIFAQGIEIHICLYTRRFLHISSTTVNKTLHTSWQVIPAWHWVHNGM